MDSVVQRQGPLDDYAPIFAELAAHELTVSVALPLGQINLRGLDHEIAQAVAATFDGLTITGSINSCIAGSGSWSLCLGPDEWLLVVPKDEANDKMRDLAAQLAGKHASIVDVSSNRIALDVGGPKAASLFSSLTSFEMANLRPGRCAQTMLAKAQVIIHPHNEPATTRVLVRTSFARYLADIIVDAARFL
ncbi:MAG: sarcosine oxidase subunit gamma [Alphaproteobacteria bacterium]|nr:sarcosine oxidase subunit gamma [Alphaproteobacteria bacterium]